MSREIKFRIWDKEAKIFVENSASLHAFSNWMIDPFTGEVVDFVASLTSHPDGTFYTRHNDPMYWVKGTKLVNESRYVAQQFTGLLDKNGKEIYEGDIINDSFIIGPVEFFNGAFLVGGTLSIGAPAGSALQPEVIGNIFENPELLKQ
jgi:hypothetical protein